MDTDSRDISELFLGNKTPQEIAEQLKQFSKNCRFLSHYLPFLQKIIPNVWVAVYQGKFVGVDVDLQRVLSYVERQGYPRTSVAIEFVYPVGKDPKWMWYAAA